ncbi:hypothetical protein E4T56_gene12340 [Termitomyces sp. T112]|nr:hypothetical protein E4T56_gene12340 [Termitomyces sp. T112]
MRAIYAFIVALICKTNAYASVVFYTFHFAELPITYFITENNSFSFGVVMVSGPHLFAVISGLPVLLPSAIFSPYINDG